MEPTRWRRVAALFHDALAGGRAKPAARPSEAPSADTVGGGHEPQRPVHAPPASSQRPLASGDRVGHYRILDRLGAGGMGVVYEAHDERLDRRVALKVLRAEMADHQARERLVREARVAARVVHPRICQVYELGASPDGPFIAMELVHGESLADRLARGPLPPAKALGAAVEILDALAVLHAHGIVHRDLKPSNVFLSGDGVKLLDFGLAKPFVLADDVTAQGITAPGLFAGTPQYASPEQFSGEAVGSTSDLFSAAVVTFEMLTGKPPFAGVTLAALVRAVTYDAPPVLTGAPAVTAADRVLHRALAKQPADRYDSAQAFAKDLRGALTLLDDGATVEARPILRLAVLPFRQLVPDAATEYLGPSLADALVGTLAGLQTLVVRSTLKSASYATVPLDLDRLATDLAVDVVLAGVLLPTRGLVRVSAELVAVPSGDVWWSHVTEVALGEVLELHDNLARRVLEAMPVSTRDKRAVPQAHAASGRAFDLYLRGMQLRSEAGAWRQALAYFTQCVDADPGFAAAWAERGRLERVLGKYGEPALLEAAEASIRKALALDPNSGAAQYYYAQLEVDLGKADAALGRLLARGWQRRAEPHVYAALVHACRYGGLLDASLAAHHEATRLDPTIATSVLHTYYMQGDFARALDAAHRSSDPFEARLLGAMGRRTEALAAARREEERFAAVSRLRAFSSALRAAFEGDRDGVLEAVRAFDESTFPDGEGLFYMAEILAEAGLADRAFAALSRAVDAGFVCRPAFDTDVYLSSLRTSPAWPSLLARVTAAQVAIVERFNDGRGAGLLGL